LSRWWFNGRWPGEFWVFSRVTRRWQTMTAESANQAQSGDQEAAPPKPPRPSSSPVEFPAHRVRRTRLGGLWVAAVLSAVVLLLLLIFILENGQSVSIGYFGAHGHLPLGVALLLAAILGILLVVIPGTGRIMQLRITAHRHRRLDAKRREQLSGPSNLETGGDDG
jgi:uncharacterized integral membrane protein